MRPLVTSTDESAALSKIRLALGLRSTAQSLGVIGRDAGIFAKHGLDLDIVREETAGPEGVRGLLADEYDIAEFGSVPLVQAAFEGKDPVILLAAEQISALHLLGAAGIHAAEDLKGRGIGVLSAAGQTGVSALEMLGRWQIPAGQVSLVELGSYPAIYKELQAGRIAAGVLTADYGIAGTLAFGFNLLIDLGRELKFQGPVVATTQRFIARHKDVVQLVVDAYVETIGVFKDAPDAVISAMKRHLGFLDEQQARAVHAFYAARFQRQPYPSEDGIRRVLELYAGRYPEQPVPSMAAIWNPSFLDRSPSP